MKKHVYLLVAAILGCFAAKANPGDTTWVQANNVNLTYYNNYDTSAVFPHGNVTYRKVYMIFTLGKYACPAGTQYCGDWDYTVQNYLMTKGGDTLELSRLITPYANSSAPRTPLTWKQRYIYDVTDFAKVLKDTAAIRIHYSGYSGGFTADVKFAFIEGTPERTVTGISRLWNGSFYYGKSTDPIANHFPAMNVTAPANTQSAVMRVLITGHGSDVQGCCEFMSKNYQVKENNNQIDQYTIWRTTCPMNELYPQSGTWLYERGNWCPGALVYDNVHKLTGVTAGSTNSVQMTFDAYTGAAPSGGDFGQYTTEAVVINYGGMNKALDASLEDIIAPTNYEGYYRENPALGNPVVRVHNSGSSAINSIVFQYNVKDSTPVSYTWNGTLPSLKDTILTLPVLGQLTQMSQNAASGVYQFEVKISTVNGQADADQTNDKMTSTFTVAPKWPTTFIVAMKTNNEGVSGVGTNPSETNWVITDMNGNVAAQRTNANISTTYNDTVNLSYGGAYKLTVTDGGCDGLSWWANPSNITDGTFIVKKLTGTGTAAYIPLSGNFYSGTLSHDFGCGFVQYFTVMGDPAGVNTITGVNGAAELEAFPNPATSSVTVQIGGVKDVKGTLTIVDALGRTVVEQSCNSVKETLNVSALANGVYTVVFTNSNAGNAKLQTRLLIAK